MEKNAFAWYVIAGYVKNNCVDLSINYSEE